MCLILHVLSRSFFGGKCLLKIVIFVIDHCCVVESCKQCGHVGSQESFCGRYKNYCSLKCVRLFRLAQHGQYSNPGTVAAAPSVQVVKCNVHAFCVQPC